MKIEKLNKELRDKLNNYLSKEYGITIPSNVLEIDVERDCYIYMNTENNNMFYIPKFKIQ